MPNLWKTCKEITKTCASNIASKPKQLLPSKLSQHRQIPMVTNPADMIPMGGSPDSLSVASSPGNSPVSDIFGHDEFVTVFDTHVVRHEQMTEIYAPNPPNIEAMEVSDSDEIFEQKYGMDGTGRRSTRSAKMDSDIGEEEAEIPMNQIFAKAIGTDNTRSKVLTGDIAGRILPAEAGNINRNEQRVNLIATEWLFLGLVMCIVVPIYLAGLSDST